MALQHLRSSTANKRPLPAGMSDGQLAVNTNTASPGLFLKDSAGALVKVGPVHVGTTAPNVSPASGGETGNTVGEQWLDTSGSTYVFKIWDGSAWRSEAGEFVNVTGDVMTGALGIIAGSAASPGLYFSGDTDTGLFSAGANQLALATGGTGRLYVNSNGDINIGHNSSIYSSAGRGLISVNGSSSSIIDLQTGTTSRFRMFCNGTDVELVNSEATGVLKFGTNNTERMRLDANGRLGLGTSSASALLHLKASAPATILETTRSFTVNRNFELAVDQYAEGIFTITPSTALGGTTFTTPALSVTGAGRVGIGTTSPSAKLDVWPASSSEAAFRGNSGESVQVPAFELRGYNTDSTNGGLDIRTNLNGTFTDRVRITNDGLVGIGTTAPQGKTEIVYTSTAPSLSSNSGAGLALAGNSTVQLNLGTYPGSPYAAWIQARDTGTSSAFPIVFNPLGGNVGIGNTGPSHQLDVVSASTSVAEFSGPANATVEFKGSGFVEGKIQCGGELIVGSTNNYPVAFVANNTERARIDSSGRLLVGTSSARTTQHSSGGSTYDAIQKLQVEDAGDNQGISIIANKADASGAVLNLAKSGGSVLGSNALVSSNDVLGTIGFFGADGSDITSWGGAIQCLVDGTPGANDMPGRLVFSTTADGASSPTERMVIKNNGTINFLNVATYADNAAATTGGLAVGDVYRTSTGQLMIRY